MANKTIISLVIGVIIGLSLYHFFFKPETETKIEYITNTTTKIERVPQLPELVFIRSPKALYLRDTVINEVTYPVNYYEGSESLKNGKITWNAETSGFLNKIDLNYEGEKEIVTTVVEKEKNTTTVIIQKGVFIGGGFNSNFSYHLGATYLGNGFMTGVSYQPQTKITQADIKINIFKR